MFQTLRGWPHACEPDADNRSREGFYERLKQLPRIARVRGLGDS